MEPLLGFFSQLTHCASKVSLKGGVVNKICRVLIVLIIGISAVLCFNKNIWLSATGILGLFSVVSYFLWKLCSLAEKNPQVALMDGVEYLIHEQLTTQMKNAPSANWVPSENRLAGRIDQELIQNANNPDSVDIKISKEK